MIKEKQEEIIDTVKLLIYKEQPSILEKIDFEDDSIFLEPLLFSYFNNKLNYKYPNELLTEILQGYFIVKEELRIKYSFNRNGTAYIPRLGYFRKGVREPFEEILKIGDFEVLKEVHPTQERYFTEFYKGHIVNPNPDHNSVWERHYSELYEAIDVIKQKIPEFYSQLIFANKKIYLHDNYKILNFTTIESLGALYFYVIGNNNLIYFIEELIHQGSHNYLYYLVHNRNDFFKIDVENLMMKDFTKQKWDYRSIYGAFHGLFTITQRVVNFDKLLSQDVFSGRQKHELLGRFADQFSRFKTGLDLLDFNQVYTEKGLQFYIDLNTKCKSILKKYDKLTHEFDLSNRDLDFRYNDFCKLNPFEDFSKKDEKGFYNFC